MPNPDSNIKIEEIDDAYIESLKTEILNLKAALENIKKNNSLDEEGKKEETKRLNDKIGELSKRIEDSILILEASIGDPDIDPAKKTTLETYKSALEDLKLDTIKEVTQLRDSILAGEKGFFTGIKDWFVEKWNNFKSKDKKEQERIVGRVAGGSLIAGFLYGLFGKKAREERRKEIDELPFWKKSFGKILKGTAIGTALVGGGYLLLKHLGLIGKSGKVDGKSSDEEKLNGYEEKIVNNPENKEKFEIYEKFGKNIDTLYGSIYDRELKSGYQDELEMQKIAQEQSDGEKQYKGIVPYCLDNQFKSVEDILGQNSSMKRVITGSFDDMIEYIETKGSDFLQFIVDNYLSKLASWKALNLTGSVSEKIQKWKVNNKKSKQEMQYFFRQSIRVQTYLFEKRDQLIPKIVKESSAKYGISEEDILGDDEKFKTYVLDTEEYKNFINNPISDAVTILKNYDIFDSEITEEKKEDIKELDNQRNEVLGCREGEKDILEIINEKKEKGEDLTDEESKALEKACDGIVKDVDENILEIVEESARNIYGDLLGTEDSHLREYLNNSGLVKVFQQYNQNIKQTKLELQEGKLSNEDKIALAETINYMLALKKEAVLGRQTIEKDYDENGNVIYRIPGFLCGSLGNLWKSAKKLWHGEFGSALNYLTSAGLGTGIIITLGGVFFGVLTGNWKVAKAGLEITALPATLGIEIGKLPYRWCKPVRDSVDKISYPFKYWGKGGPDKLLDLLENGKITLKDAAEIVEGKTRSRGILHNTTEKTRKKAFNITDKTTDVKEAVFQQLVKKRGEGSGFTTRVKDIKDAGVYETLLENYDSSPEIRQAINDNASLDNLKKVAEQSTIPEAVRNNPHYQRVSSDLDELVNRTLRGRNIDQLSNAERFRLDDISEFRKSLQNMNPKDIERTVDLLGEFRGGSSLGDAISQLATLKQIRDAGKIDTGLLDELGQPITKNWDDIVKNMDFDALRGCKGGKISGVSDDAIEALAKAFERIHRSRGTKLSSNIDEILESFKVLFKLVGKAT